MSTQTHYEALRNDREQTWVLPPPHWPFQHRARHSGFCNIVVKLTTLGLAPRTNGLNLDGCQLSLVLHSALL